MVTSKSHSQRKWKTNLFSLEALYNGCFEKLVLDLTAQGSRERAYGLEKMSDRRAAPSLSYLNAGPHTYKVWAQLENFHKRLIFPDDPSFEEISQTSLQDFCEYQQKSQLIDSKARPVIDRARVIVDDILGEFSMDRFADFCFFSKKAALNLTRKNSYLDKRIKNLNGTREQINLFNEIRARDIHLLRATRREIKHVQVVKSINVTSVPKSHKAARIIGPDTVIGGFLSKGLGSYMRDRLEASTHIDLSLQQERHKEWAREGSLRGHLATIDMSKASDSFMPCHLQALLSPEWLAIVNCMRTSMFHTVDSEPRYLASMMLMGSGHTFPLQTILFYAITKATCELLKITGVVSVYGDDIIVPNDAAPALTQVFEWMGFSINKEKSAWSTSFVHDYKFRESCGGDYVSGCPVRPWMPECIVEDVRKTAYIAEIHKLINGLSLFWHPTEVEGTLEFLLQSLNSVCTVSFVPNNETETSGVRVELSPWLNLDLCEGFNIPHVKDGVTTYIALRVSTKMRKKHGRIHYWNWLKRAEGTTGSLRRLGHAYRKSHNQTGPRNRAGTVFGKESIRGGRLQYRWTREGGS